MSEYLWRMWDGLAAGLNALGLSSKLGQAREGFLEQEGELNVYEFGRLNESGELLDFDTSDYDSDISVGDEETGAHVDPRLSALSYEEENSILYGDGESSSESESETFEDEDEARAALAHGTLPSRSVVGDDYLDSELVYDGEDRAALPASVAKPLAFEDEHGIFLPAGSVEDADGESGAH